MRYQFVVYTATMLLLLTGCGSNQTADVDQPNISTHDNIHNAVEITPQKAPTIPIDGRLRDEHLKMYVSVKIKEEQLRYAAETASANIHIAQVANPSTDNTKPVNEQSKTINAPTNYEKKAIEEFEFNSYLYLWAKQTIANTLAHEPLSDTLRRKRASNFTEYVVNHNLQMVDKYRDQLEFAEHYKLHPPTSIVQHAAKIGPEAEDLPKALILLPSS